MTRSVLDLYESVTRQIILALEAGTSPWVCPWRGAGLDSRPSNGSTGRPYRGINVLLLNLQVMSSGFARNRWMTYQQALGVGGQVRRGEQGTPIIFFKMHEIDAGAARESNGDSDRRVVPLLRAFTVFNVEQIDGLPGLMSEGAQLPNPWPPIAMAEHVLAESGADLRHGGSRAFYLPTEDYIQMPPRAAFECAGDYYATALHELTHWTGHESRCHRPLGRRHGIDAYAFEELVAEIGAAFLTDYCGIVGRMQHANYIANWLQALRNDKRLVFTAAAQAQRAADFLLQVEHAAPAGAQASAPAIAA